MIAHTASRRCKLKTITDRHPGALVIDVISKGEEPWVRFSPFFPLANIPVPNSPDRTSQSVEGVWQALKVFESEDVDVAKLDVVNMKGIKRSVRTRGRVLGHRFGIGSETMLSYLDARKQIDIPTYKFVLENRLANEVSQLREILKKQDVVLLDYETNGDIENLLKPLSHASLVVRFLNDDWPAC